MKRREREATSRAKKGEDEEGKGVRPSSFIAPVEKNAELSNGAAAVITIKSR